MVAHKPPQSTKNRTKTDNLAQSAIGMCINCAKRLTMCGEPFTADIECPNCGAVNVYEESQQPARIKAA
jgi:hypothetical protein